MSSFHELADHSASPLTRDVINSAELVASQLTRDDTKYLSDDVFNSPASSTHGSRRNSTIIYPAPQTSTILSVAPVANAELLNSDLSIIASIVNTVREQPNSPLSVSNRIAADLIELMNREKATNNRYSPSPQILSDVEAAILRSSEPVTINETDEIEVLGQRGIYANKSEILKWRGLVPISEYRLNEDPNPQIITKKSKRLLKYTQELAIRYLRPPTPPAPGEIVITQEENILTPPAPPLVIRQQPVRPHTPEPLVIREAPPIPPKQVGRKLVTISGKRLPPPPRKVVIERLAQLPAKPQSVLIERWLPYADVKRRVIFQAAPPDPIVVKPRNTIIQWDQPFVEVKKEFKYLGVIRANPADYVNKFGAELKEARDLPDFVNDVRTPDGIILAAQYRPLAHHELEGDLHALKLVDLEKEGLGVYTNYLAGLGVLEDHAASVIQASASFRPSVSATFTEASPTSNLILEDLIRQIFNTIDRNGNGRITVEDAQKSLLRLNSRLARNYGETDLNTFFDSLDRNKNNSLDYDEFKRAFLNIAI